MEHNMEWAGDPWSVTLGRGPAVQLKPNAGIGQGRKREVGVHVVDRTVEV